MKLLVIAVASFLSACATDDLGNEDVSQSEQFLKPTCDEWGCGLNSPYFDSRGFYWLYQNGAANTDGFAITKFVDKTNVPYTFSVTDSRITAIKSGFPSVTGAKLVGFKLYISFRGRPMYQIKIVAVDRTMSWAAQNGVRYPIDTYWFQWSGDDAKFQDMCQGDHLDDTLGMDTHHTIVFEGDRIESTSKSVTPGIDPNVVNFGCAGSALAKMALTAHNEVGKHKGFSTTTAERTTILKMFSADYCGHGTPFTVGGQLLQWADDKDWMNVATNMSVDVESVWTPTGASCLNIPRLIKNPTALGDATFPNLASDIAAACGGSAPPVCVGVNYSNPSPSHLVSSNPGLILLPH